MSSPANLPPPPPEIAFPRVLSSPGHTSIPGCSQAPRFPKCLLPPAPSWEKQSRGHHQGSGLTWPREPWGPSSPGNTLTWGRADPGVVWKGDAEGRGGLRGGGQGPRPVSEAQETLNSHEASHPGSVPWVQNTGTLRGSFWTQRMWNSRVRAPPSPSSPGLPAAALGRASGHLHLRGDSC